MQKDSYNRGGYIAFLFSMAFSLAFFIYISAVHKGVDLKEVSQPTEGAEQTLAGEAAKTVDVSAITQPWIENADMAAHGKKVYGMYCAMCHGPGGAGDGVAGAGLNPPPRNLVEGKWKKGGTSIALYTTLVEGIAGSSMVSFAGSISPKDRWALVQFIRTISTNVEKDDPAQLELYAKTAK